MRHIRQIGLVLLTVATAMPAMAQEALPPGGPSEGAGASEALNQLAVRQWVRPDASGVIRGSVVTPRGGGLLDTVSGVTVALVSEDLSVHRTRTQSDGSFELAGAEPGLHGLFVLSENLTAAYALHVLSPAAPQDATVTGDLRVPAAPVSQNYIRQVVRSLIPEASDESAYRFRGFETDPLSGERLQDDLFRVALAADGSMSGRVVLPPSAEDPSSQLASLNVAIVEGDRTVARSEVAEDGLFRLENLTPGVYGLVVAGRAGFATVGFELVPSDATVDAVSADGSEQLVSFNAVAMQFELNLEIVPQQIASGFLRQVFGPAGPPGGPLAGLGPAPLPPFAPGFGPGGGFGPGAGGGGFGGGAGGGGTGGGLGPLLGLGALAGVAAAVASDDGGQRTIPDESPDGT